VKRSRSLIIVPSDPPEASFVDIDVGEELQVGDRVFFDPGFGDWIGFYDWLRSSGGEVLGVRSWLDDEAVAAIRDHVVVGNFVDWSGQQLRFWFSEQREFNEALSSDQELGTHRIMRGPDNELALTFNLERLSEAEFDTLISNVRSLPSRGTRLG